MDNPYHSRLQQSGGIILRLIASITAVAFAAAGGGILMLFGLSAGADPGIDLSAPFVQLVVFGCLAALVSGLAGILLYRKVSATIRDAGREMAALAKNESIMRAYFTHCPWPVTIVDPDGRYQFVSKAFEESLQTPKETIIGKTVRARRSKAFSESVLSHQRRVLETGMTISEVRTESPDRPDLNERISTKFPIFDNRGKVTGIGTYITDISDLRRTEKALRTSENRLTAIFENMPFGFSLKDLDGRYQIVNKPYADRFGMEADEMIGRTMFDISRVSARAEELTAIEQGVAENGGVVTTELTLTGAGGKQENFIVLKFPTYSDNGDVAGIGTFAIDITTQKQTEEALKKSERLLRSIFDNSPSAITMKGLDGRYQLVSRHIQDWYGTSAYNVEATTADEVFPEPIATWATKQDQEVVTQNRTLVVETDHIFRDGTVHRVVISKFPVPGSDGKPVGIGSIVTDVTAQRKSEEQLRQAQKMEVVGQLTGGVAHDFNNLLGVIIGNLDFLKSTIEGDTRSTKLIENAMKAAHNGAELNRRLLAFSRKQPLAPKLLELNDHVAGMYDILARSLGENINITTTYCAELWPCIADPAQVESALLNLAVNARDAMPDGGVLKLETRNVEIQSGPDRPAPNLEPGLYIMLSVSDTGMGMPPEVLEHAFEPFFTTKDVGKGSGLGLSMVFGFARQSGGDVSIQSVSGSGTTVSLFLPKADVTDIVVEQSAEEFQPRSCGETILVLEDNPEMMEVCQRFLRNLGYDAIAAENGRAAKAILDREPHIDALLCDVVLPGELSGPEFAQTFMQRYPAGRVLFISGYTPDGLNFPAGIESNGTLLQKPFTKAQLALRLRAVLDGAVQRRAISG